MSRAPASRSLTGSVRLAMSASVSAGPRLARMTSVKVESPAYHTTEDGRWDYRVTITFPNSTAATTANPQEEALIKQLYPDQETYKREEQRRFEILVSHWDLPVTDITPSK